LARRRFRWIGPRWREAIRVGPLGLPAARETFIDIAGARFKADPDLDRLLEAVDRLPIAVVLLAHQAEVEPNLAALWKRWQEKRTSLLKRAEGKERLTNIEISLDLSLDSPRMTAEAQRLLAVLALLPDGVAHEDLDALMPSEGGEAAAVLKKVGLAFDQGSRLRVFAPVREYVSRQHPAEEEDLARAVDHYLRLARKGRLVGRTGGAEATARLVQELGNLDVMISRGLELDDPEPAIRAAGDLGALLRFSGWGSQEPLQRALRVAEAAGRQQLEADCILSLGEIALDRSDHDAARARYEEALPLFRNVGVVLGEANCIRRLGDIALAKSDTPLAGDTFREALRLYERVAEPYSMGWIQVRLARLEEVGSEERKSHVRAAREAWESIRRPDLVEKLKDEFGEDFEG
jgi:tetratricopeptide (TPR) repeat protein